MKRFFISLICLIMVFLLPVNSYAQIIGHIYKTDITAYENYLQIPSYNCGGTTVVFARDLENYGYDILWNGTRNTVEIKKNNSKKATPILPYFEGYTPVGEILYDIYKSTIKTYYKGKEIPSYNIGGKIAVRIRDLDFKSTMDYNDEYKTAYFTSKSFSITDEEEQHCKYYYRLLSKINQLDFDISEAISQMDKNKISSYDLEMINASYKAFSDAKEEFTEYTEPDCFTESTTELWWAMVNIELATNLVFNNKNSFNSAQHELYQRYYYDSVNQRQVSLELFSEELSLKEK